LTIVKNDLADAFVKQPPEDLRLFLVHGNDDGLIHERAKALVLAFVGADDGFNVVLRDGDAAAREPGELIDEAHAISLFGGRRAIWIEAGARDLKPALEPLFDRPPIDCAIVVEAGSLKRGLALRELFERANEAAAIECYPDDRRSLLFLIETQAREAGLTVSSDAADLLIGHLGADRMTSRGEIAKLMLYAQGEPRVEVEHVEAIVSDAAPSSLDAVIDRSLSGDAAALEGAMAHFLAEGGDPGALMARLFARVSLLCRLRLEMDQGRSFDAAAQANFVRLPPQARSALARQAETLTFEALARRLPAFSAAAARVRREPRLAEATAMRFLWTLASGAARSRRG